MPRRPRPQSRQPPKSAQHAASVNSKSPAPAARSKPALPPKSSGSAEGKGKRKYEEFFDDEDEGEVEDDDDSEGDEGALVGMRASGGVRRAGADDVESSEDDEDEEDEESEEDLDLDAPRVAQWQGEDDDDLNDDSNGEEMDVSDFSSRVKARSKGVDNDVDKLEDDLSSLPLGALRKAQRALALAEPDSDSSDPEQDDSHDEVSNAYAGTDADSDAERSDASTGRTKKKGAEKVEWSTAPRTDIPKRTDKGAPVEVTSKRPVSRRRQVVDAHKKVAKDPRFLSTHPSSSSSSTPTFSPSHFQKSYAFLTTARKTELTTLLTALSTARKHLANSPHLLRADREAEVSRLEAAVRRTQGLVNQDKKDAIERDALAKVRGEERRKREAGKGGWWMKDGERREVLARARLEAVEREGGKGAVRKAVERRKRKEGQREKRSRPWVRDGDGEGGRRGVGGMGTGANAGVVGRGGRGGRGGGAGRGRGGFGRGGGGTRGRGTGGGDGGPPKRRKVF